MYFTERQRLGLDQRARREGTTLASVVRAAVDRYLADDLSADERERALRETFGVDPGLAARVPSRDEWSRD